MVTFAELRTLDTLIFRTAAAAYGRLADNVALRADDVHMACARLGGWNGEAADAAIQRAKQHVVTCDLLNERLNELARALADHAGRMEQLQRLLADIVLEIGTVASGTLRIDLRTGAITVNVATGGVDDLPVKPPVLQAREQRAAGYAQEISDLLRLAAAADAETASRITGILAAVVGGALPADAAALLAGVPDVGTDPLAVKAWWAALSPQEREFLIRERPDVIGWLDGVPAADRDEANRLMLNAIAEGLARRRAALLARGPLSEAEQQELDDVNAKLKGIGAIRDRMNLTEVGFERTYLLGFDARGNGKAIVAVGNPDTADNVVTYVPGTGARLAAAAGDLARADRMTNDAQTFDPAHRTSTIMWIGYEAPQSIVPQAMDPSWARAAADDLDRFQDGLRITHEGAPSHNTVVGHSYGSTVVGYTAGGYGLDADDVVFVGSPGVGVDTVGELRGADGQPLPADHVWSSHAYNDPIQYASYADPALYDSHGNRLPPDDVLVHGRNPSEPEFGGRQFTSDPGDALATAHAHSQYWDPYSSSLRNMTYIVTGHQGQVT